ncbi:MAG TPA: hypothetical protein VJS11_10585, partial [Acidobacteriaceae bacterium]|nr:hypothetical protein [Acidobacteriaceae bacterium]
WSAENDQFSGLNDHYYCTVIGQTGEPAWHFSLRSSGEATVVSRRKQTPIAATQAGDGSLTQVYCSS